MSWRMSPYPPQLHHDIRVPGDDPEQLGPLWRPEVYGTPVAAAASPSCEIASGGIKVEGDRCAFPASCLIMVERAHCGMHLLQPVGRLGIGPPCLWP
jgi:hypothetical protein